jgi:hypothetical protein
MAEKKSTTEKTAPAYKVKRAITVPLVKLNPGEPLAVRFLGEPQRRVQLDQKPDKDGNLKEEAHVIRGVNLDTGELVDVIASTVLISQLEREYGNIEDKLKDVALLIENKGKRTGKAYNDISIYELEVE